jgi:NADH-quinone oxidoreductase subunit H
MFSSVSIGFILVWFGGSLLAQLLMLICVLISVAYATLLERKVMASMQRRMGPNVVGYLGVLQPLADGLKLLIKETIIPRKANKFLFVAAPVLVLLLSLYSWVFLPLSPYPLVDLDLGLLYLIVLGALEIYGILFAGWASNSKYALLGGLRASAQMISYELIMSFIYLVFVFIVGSFSLVDIVLYQEDMWFIVSLFPLAIIFFIAMLAETNRTPFDLPEAEAELVAGYNVEYSGMLFAFFFLGEYSNMLFLSALFSLLFLGGWTPMLFGSFFLGSFFFAIKIIFVLFCFVWVRATLPRYRYDQLMRLGWNVFLPFTFVYFFVLVMLFYSVGELPQFWDIYPTFVWPIFTI